MIHNQNKLRVEEDEFFGLPPVTDAMLAAEFERTEREEMTMEERLVQMVSFVWGNALEGDRGTYDSVCKNLKIDLQAL